MKKIAIVYSDYYKEITDGLFASFNELNNELGYEVEKFRVAGSMEIPLKCKQLMLQGQFDGYCVYGCIIEGETYHNFVLQDAIYQHLLGLSLEFMKPVGFGILTVKNYQQALNRAVGPKSRGKEALEAVNSLLI